MFLIPYPGSYVSLFVQGQWTWCGEAIDPRESYVTQGASVAYTWVVGRDPLVDRLGSVSSNRKSFEKMGPCTFWGGPLFPVGPVGILVEWIAPVMCSEQFSENN